MLKTRAVILAEKEVTYGTDPTPLPASNAILCEAPEIEVLGRKLERNNVKSYFGTLAPINVGDGVKISITTELKGSGTAGTPPEIGPLLEACGMTYTNVPATSDKYDPNSDLESDQDSVTIYFYQHNIAHKIVGCRGNWSLEGKAAEYGKIKFEFTGIYAGPVDENIPAATFNATLPPKLVSASFALGAYAAIIENFKVDLGNEIAKRPSVNAATGILSYFIKERAVKGEIDPEAVALSAWNPWNLWSNSTRAILTITFGATAGNKCVISGPKVMLDSVKYADRESLLIYSTPLIFTPDAGNDEVSLLFI
jgi:hypothetical protein